MFGKFEGRIALVPGGSSGIEPCHAIRNGNAPQLPDRFSCPVGGVADQRRLIASRAIVVEFKGSLGGARMAASAQYEADRGDGSNIDGDSSGQQPSFAAQ